MQTMTDPNLKALRKQTQRPGKEISSASKPASTGKRIEDKASENSVSSVYKAEIAESSRNVMITWSKSLSVHSLTIALENLSDEQNPYTCKIDLKSCKLWGRKGLKSLEVDGKRVDVYWDFRQAKFAKTPEPHSDYYIAIICEETVALIAGDLENEALKRTQRKPSSAKATLVCKKEHVYAKRAFYTRAVLDGSKQEHDVVIESSLFNLDDPEMFIMIDGIVVIRIMNLNWRFRGNEIITLKNISVEIFWDVHDWLFDASGLSNGLFIFKPVGLVKSESQSRNNSFNDSKHDDIQSFSEYCHVLYAWKID